MSWFGRKKPVQSGNLAVEVRRALVFQVDQARKMTGQDDLKEFYSKPTILGYLYGFIMTFLDEQSANTNNIGSMLFGAALYVDYEDSTQTDIQRSMIRRGAPYWELAREMKTKGSSTFESFYGSGANDCREFLAGAAKTFPTLLTVALVTEIRNAAQGTPFNTDNLIPDPLYGEGYYRELLKTLVDETDGLQETLQFGLKELHALNPAFEKIGVDASELLYFCAALLSFSYILYAAENKGQKENVLDDYSYRMVSAICDDLEKRTGTQINESDIQSRYQKRYIAYKESFGDTVVNRTQDDKLAKTFAKNAFDRDMTVHEIYSTALNSLLILIVTEHLKRMKQILQR